MIRCTAHAGHVATCINIKGKKWVGQFSLRILCTSTVYSDVIVANVFAVCTINANQLCDIAGVLQLAWEGRANATVCENHCSTFFQHTCTHVYLSSKKTA